MRSTHPSIVRCTLRGNAQIVSIECQVLDVEEMSHCVDGMCVDRGDFVFFARFFNGFGMWSCRGLGLMSDSYVLCVVGDLIENIILGCQIDTLLCLVCTSHA